MTELVQRCHRCDGKGEEVSGDGTQKRYCLVCHGLGKVLDDGVSSFICALLDDEDVYRRILTFAKKLKRDLAVQ